MLDEPRISDTLGKDLLSNGMAIFALLFLLVLAIMNPPTTDDDSKSPGMLSIELRWPDNIDVDIDLWAHAPGDIVVGYSSKSGRTMNLLRDDLGQRGDDLGLNYENMWSRGLPYGRYCVNVHYYSGKVPNVPIMVRVQVKGPAEMKANRGANTLFVIEDILEASGQELTIMCFNLDESLKATERSRVFVPLRSKK